MVGPIRPPSLRVPRSIDACANPRRQSANRWHQIMPMRWHRSFAHRNRSWTPSLVGAAPSLPAISTQQLARDDDAHDLVGAFQDLVHAQIAHQLLDAEVLEVAVAAVDLQRLVAHL